LQDGHEGKHKEGIVSAIIAITCLWDNLRLLCQDFKQGGLMLLQ
jgi:hypothetical protein